MAVTSGNDDWMLLNACDNNSHVNIAGNYDNYIAHTTIITRTTITFEIRVNECDLQSNNGDGRGKSKNYPRPHPPPPPGHPFKKFLELLFYAEDVREIEGNVRWKCLLRRSDWGMRSAVLSPRNPRLY